MQLLLVRRPRFAVCIIGTLSITITIWFMATSHFRLALNMKYRKLSTTDYEVGDGYVHLPRQQKNRVMFLKTHKTGSSTVTNILNRFGVKNNLTFALPKDDVIFNWPKRLKSDFMVTTWTSPDILCNHARYSKNFIHYLFPKDKSTYITILREPLANYESIYNYMQLWKYLDIKGNNSMDILHKYLLNVTTFKSAKLARKDTLRLIRNPMMYDLGLDFRYFQDKQAINKYIKFLEEEFDLVMMMEYFDESAVLLKRLMNWEFDDVVFIKHNERQKKEKKTLTPILEANLKSWNKADFILYEHFNNTFWLKVAAEGSDFYKDLANFRKRKQEVFDMCVGSKPTITEIYHGKFVQGHSLKKDIPDDKKVFCTNLIKSELVFYRENMEAHRRRQAQLAQIDGLREFKNEFDVENDWGKANDFPYPLHSTTS